mmetsp:Transcript_27407/g.33895  ORF Transcript_27407/g.33895 Transcript_27407/m.33895 type:complete len:537 (+) Transcript_27407:202-1812(+)
MSSHIVIPGQIIATTNLNDEENSFLRGHGTYLENVNDEDSPTSNIQTLNNSSRNNNNGDDDDDDGFRLSKLNPINQQNDLHEEEDDNNEEEEEIHEEEEDMEEESQLNEEEDDDDDDLDEGDDMEDDDLNTDEDVEEDDLVVLSEQTPMDQQDDLNEEEEGEENEERSNLNEKNDEINDDTSTTLVSSPIYPPDATGSWSNCTTTNDDDEINKNPRHVDERFTVVSCKTIPYRVKKNVFSQAPKVVIGVLSGAGGKGPTNRQSIRDTWADGQNGIFFLVAGSWDEIADEYDIKGDLIWIDEEEVYDGEKSVLTYKTQSFVSIVYDLASDLGLDISYAFKTDDDSYIHIQNLYYQLLEAEHELPHDFWGWCQRKKFAPLRDQTSKWPVSYELYPEPMYPRYCQGAGFALSWKFIECATEEHHIASIRFMPFEDVAVGLLAKRCNIQPTTIKNENLMNMYRFGRSEEVWRTNNNQDKMEKNKLPKPNMKNGRIVQHRIYDDWDMKEHHKIVMDETNYELESDVKWYYRPELEEGGERR